MNERKKLFFLIFKQYYQLFLKTVFVSTFFTLGCSDRSNLEVGSKINNYQGNWNLTEGFPGVGYYASISNIPLSTDIRSGVSILGVTGNTNVVNTSGANALSADIALGKTAFVGGNSITGTMPTQTLSSTSTAVTAGYYSATTLYAIDNDLISANIRAGATIFGIAGNSNVVDTSLGDAAAANILSGKSAYAGGSLVTGAMPTQTLSASSTTLSAGYYASTFLYVVDTDLTAANICSGISIFGVAGTAICNSIFSDLIASNMHRNVASAQITLTTEKSASGSYPAAYREVPNVFKDDDGFFTSAQGCSGSGGDTDTCTTTIYAAHGAAVCGTSGTIDARISNCATVAGVAATWDGAVNGTGGEAVWKLVSRINNLETWRDERTGLLWSDTDSTAYTWCDATGNNQGDDPSGTCIGNTRSVCSEFGGALAVFNGDNYAVTPPTYSDFKGGIGAGSTPAIHWRLPTRADYYQADIDGIRFVVPNMTDEFWSSTIQSDARGSAWIYSGYNGGSRISSRNVIAYAVRCVGR